MNNCDPKSASHVSVLCLAITGAEDNYAPPIAVQDFVKRLPVKASYEEFAGCGHMIFFEAPEKFNRVIADFLDTTLAS